MFQDEYRTAASTSRMANMEINPELLIPNQYRFIPGEDTSLSHEAYLHLLAGGNISTSQIFSFSFEPLSCHMVIYSYGGGGRLGSLGSSQALSEGTMTVFDCRNGFTLQSVMLPWNFKIFFIQGESMSLFAPSLGNKCSYEIPEHSPLLMDLYNLFSIPDYYTGIHLLKMHSLLTNLLCSLCIASKDSTTPELPDIPHYLVEMKDYLDHHYDHPLTLSHFEDMLGISKYRLCREFSSCFGSAPLHYLGIRRLERAKEMLLSSDRNVHEISSIIGYDNVNHFINMFKKYTGITPGGFRQKALAAQPVLHCPAPQMSPEA